MNSWDRHQRDQRIANFVAFVVVVVLLVTAFALISHFQPEGRTYDIWTNTTQWTDKETGQTLIMGGDGRVVPLGKK